MSRTNRVFEPMPETMARLCQAQAAVASQKTRVLKCPYCGRSTLIVFEDTNGHIQTKCKGNMDCDMEPLNGAVFLMPLAAS